MATQSLQDKLLGLPCYFSWVSLQNESVGRPVQMNIDNLEEHIHEAIQGTEVMSYNLMGFYKTQQEHFKEARANFEKALEYSKTEDDRIVSFGCLAWLTWNESSSDSEAHVVEYIDQVQNILRGRKPEGIPEVMAGKAFAIANSGFTEKGYNEALACIDRALEKQSDDVTYKFTKATLLQKSYLAKHKSFKRNTEDGADVQNIKLLWEELIACLEKHSTMCPVLYGLALVQYALFLGKIHRDFGASGKKYAEKAEDVGRSHQATAVMRNVASFYICSASENSYSELYKAELILKEILKSKPGDDYKELTILGNCFSKMYKTSPRSADANFNKAEECFRKAWELNKKYFIPAFDLVRLYQLKYINGTKDVSVLAKAEKIFKELFQTYEKKEDFYKGMLCSKFGKFLKDYGRKLASFYLQCFPGDYQLGDSAKSPAIEQALQLIHQYEQDKQDEHLLQAEQVFKQLYISYEELRDPVKARFHEEYAAFLQEFSDHLAFCYLTKALEHNPHQGHAYKPLEELARDKIASQDRREQIKGHRTLERIAQLQEGP